ncbi:hypothetical protein MINTM020_47600 [Mycobacterium paraintracellulare]|uniref:hypothetical protein n=1 Tax=Mycobacterium avium complex (MAC) TaxID=120793 RepID=UPI001927A2BB|nr:hypothetical protein [Mycobacterium paraintracellulare]BCO43905.1 hypothetical protein MINTM001_50440 [Mycobacterium paraintracellulare]BCP12662.1 hypothetical protein MINTM020_47600 [Mycobacterium paraintracellulare]
MTTMDERMMAEVGRLEWRNDDKPPTTLTARRFRRDGDDMWVATKCGVYINSEALLEKHREMVEAYPNACVIRLSVSEFDWVARAEKRGMKVA